MAGLALVGHYLNALQPAFKRLDAAMALRSGVSNSDVLRSYLELIEARRPDDLGHDLWTTFQRTQENLMRGGQPGRSVQGRRTRTRAIGSIDRNVSLNRALWTLAEEMRRIKG